MAKRKLQKWEKRSKSHWIFSFTFIFKNIQILILFLKVCGQLPVRLHVQKKLQLKILNYFLVSQHNNKFEIEWGGVWEGDQMALS